jgi:hypothetical protein
VVRGGTRELTGQIGRRRSPVARGKGWGGISEPLRTWRRLGSGGGNLWRRCDRDRWPAAEVNSGGGGPVVGGGEDEAGELQGDVEKLEASSIGVEKGRE